MAPTVQHDYRLLLIATNFISNDNGGALNCRMQVHGIDNDLLSNEPVIRHHCKQPLGQLVNKSSAPQRANAKALVTIQSALLFVSVLTAVAEQRNGGQMRCGRRECARMCEEYAQMLEKVGRRERVRPHGRPPPDADKRHRFFANRQPQRQSLTVPTRGHCKRTKGDPTSQTDNLASKKFTSRYVERPPTRRPDRHCRE
jgi:hypothetical protein